MVPQDATSLVQLLEKVYQNESFAKEQLYAHIYELSKDYQVETYTLNSNTARFARNTYENIAIGVA